MWQKYIAPAGNDTQAIEIPEEQQHFSINRLARSFTKNKLCFLDISP
jgi:hypothetical protein